MQDDLSLRTTFDLEAARYHRARPAPPEKLINAVLEQGRLEPSSRILEVGCGTAQATRPLAERGLRVYALELGPTLAELARANLQGLDVTVETVAFEVYGSDTPFDALVSVQAFHWIKPKSGLEHAASLLRPGGAILLAWHPDRTPDTPFNRAAHTIHNRYEAPLNRPTPTHAPEKFVTALNASPDFGSVQVSRYAWTHRYDKARYLDLLLTYSNVQALEPSLREHFLAAMAVAIDAHGGQVERFYKSVLLSAVRLE